MKKSMDMHSIYENIVLRMSDPVVVFNTDDTLSLANPSGERLIGDLGFTVKSLKMDTFIEATHLKPFDTLEDYNDNVRIDTLMGERYYHCECKKEYDAKGQYLGACFHFTDFTGVIVRFWEQSYQADHDDLTGLYSKDAFCYHGARLLEKYYHDDFCLVCSNIIEFKLVNETYGVEVGNQVLEYVGNFLEEFSQDKVIVSRLNSDHFAILMPSMMLDVNYLKEHSYMKVNLENYEIIIRILYGVYDVKRGERDVAAMCERANIAIEQEAEKSSVGFYTERMRSKLLLNTTLMEHFPIYMNNKNFVPFVQPQVEDGKIVGGEVLVRLKIDDVVTTPDAFVPVLENSGKISELDVYIWEETCKLLNNMKNEHLPMYPLSVNVSGMDFEIFDLFDVFMRLTDEYEIPHELLRIEITETIFVNRNMQLHTIEKLRNEGFLVEMDDFGSGYSSLNMLKDMPIDIVKLDMGFIQDCEKSKRGQLILETAIHLVQNLGMDSIAEGVETEKQIELLSNAGNKTMQGYYFHKPMAAQDYIKLLKGLK